jgi:5-methylcytosine-specific restriction protein B
MGVSHVLPLVSPTPPNDPTKDKDFKDLPEQRNLIKVQQAYRLACSKAANVALGIDEINRGNSSAIFGTVFQLLDRDDDGWSSYKINITEIELLTILRLMGVKEKPLADNKFEYQFPGEHHWVQEYSTFQDRVNCLQINLKDRSIKIPPNLSILATMNTSDDSIYYMDSAFKRRWDWEFIDWNNNQLPPPNYGERGTLCKQEWEKLLQNLNSFIKSHYASVRGIEDKQIGYFFIKQPVTAQKIQNKLMFFLWDSVFTRDKKPLRELLNVEAHELVTFGDFTRKHNDFVSTIMSMENNDPIPF